MPIKVKETVDRECCQIQDLLKYQGCDARELEKYHPKFCKCCGQIWISQKRLDAGGHSDSELVRCKVGDVIG